MNLVQRHARFFANYNSRRTVYDWRDVRDVLRLKLPPYRWSRCVPLPKFAIGIRRHYGVWVLMCGWWGLRVGKRNEIRTSR